MTRGTVTVAGVYCKARGCGKSFSSLAGVRKHFRETGHESFGNTKVRRKRVNPEGYANRGKTK